MKTTRKILFSILVAIFLSAAGLLAACGNTVKLRFETNGGDAIAAVEAEKGSEVELPTPAREGYAFEGWYTEKDLTGEGVRGTIEAPAKDTTYYAKWERGYELTLDVAGGVLPGGLHAKLWLKEGEPLSAALRAYLPEREGLSFHGWFDGDEEIGSSSAMPAEPLTLTAKYDVAYSVRVYLQDLAQKEYEPDGEVHSYSGLVGEKVSAPNISPRGFLRASHADEKTELVLSERADENVMSLYFDRETYSVVFDANAPYGFADAPEGFELLFGDRFTVKKPDLSFEGYRFSGWSVRSSGTAEYGAGDSVTVDGNMVLYAIWDRGYIDRYGGSDLVFLPAREEGVAVLRRGGVEFEGTASGDRFSFSLPSGELLEGRVFGDTFSYRREAVAGLYHNYDPYAGVPDDRRVDESITLDIDDYQNAVYTEDGQSFRGSVTQFSDDEYIFAITEGTSAGEGFLFKIIYLDDGNGNVRKVFARSLGEIGYYYEFVYSGTVYAQAYCEITLDGFGVLLYTDNREDAVYEMVGEYSVADLYYDDSGNVSFLIEGTVEITDWYGRPVEELSLSFYTIWLSDVEMYAFVRRGEAAGVYESEADGRLELDGYNVFFDSAKYTDAQGTEVVGAYTVEEHALTDDVITVHVTDPATGRLTGQTVSFELSGEQTFRRHSGSAFDEYYRLYYDERDGDGLYLPLLALYEEEMTEDGKTLGFKTELYGQRDSEYFLAGRGYTTVERLGSGAHTLDYYTFTRQWVAEGQEDLVMESFSFLLNSVTNGSGRFNCYYTFVEEGEPRYTVIGEENGSGMIWSARLTNDMGSIYFRTVGTDAEGEPVYEVYEGALSAEENIVGETIGTFTYINAEEARYEYLYVRLIEDDAGNLTFVPLGEDLLERPMYRVNEQGVMSMDVTFVLYQTEDGRGDAAYAADGDWGGQYIEGYYEETDYTSFGERYYTFYNRDGAPVFEFVISVTYGYVDGGVVMDLYRYWTRSIVSGDKETTYTDEENGTLVLDRFHTASYTAKNGRPVTGDYHTDSSGRTVYFESGDLVFAIVYQGGRPSGFTMPDAAYGYHRYYRSATTTYSLYFNGEGVVELWNENHNRYLGTDGVYRVLEGDLLECLVTIDITGRQEETFVVSFDQNGDIVVRGEEYGVYLDDEWNVLRLDGYGGASYYGDLGNSAKRGTIFEIDRAAGFSYVAFEDWSRMYVVIGEGGFRQMEYAEEYLYFTENFSDGIGFDTDGIAEVNGHSGYYLVEGEEATLYLLEGDGGFTVLHVPAPGSAPYEYEGKEYHLYHGERITLTGEITFGEGVDTRYLATLAFTPNSTMISASALLDLKDEGTSYTVTFTNYRQGAETEHAPFLLYNNAYNALTVRYTGGETGTFSAVGGTTTTVRYDEYDYLSGTSEHRSALFTEYYGFGPIQLGDRTVRGELYYEPLLGEDGAPFAFDADYDDLKVVMSDNVNGDLYLLTFEREGDRYGMFFYANEDGYYDLYVMTTYSEAADGDMTVGLGNYVYASYYTFYGGLQAGNPVITVLYRDGKPVLPFNSRVCEDGSSAWLVAQGSYDASTGEGELGAGYFIGFTLTEEGDLASVTVEEYVFCQAQTDPPVYSFNFFLGEDGTIERLVAVIVYDYDEEAFLFVGILSYTETDGVYTVVCADGYTYTVQFVYDGAGEHAVTSDGAWLVEINVARTPA